MSASEIREVRVELGERSYSVRIGPGILDGIGEAVRTLCPAPNAAVVTDSNVGPLYADQALASLRQAGYEAHCVTVPAGDGSKSLDQAAKLYDAMAAARIERRSPLIALGGGMVGDLTGFVAATWLRGVPFVQCSTTIEANVDAATGGKTAVNHPAGKNLVGAFYQPRLVVMDTSTLDTLEDRDFRAGLAESVKHGAIRDTAFFAWHESHVEPILAHEPAALADLLERNVQIKAAVVAADEREAGLRAILNFGHTIGHAVESLMHYEWRHGECVAVGMVAVARLAVRRGLMADADAERMTTLLRAFGLPTEIPARLAAEDIVRLTKMDKKVAAGRVRFVLVPRFGETVLRDDITDADIRTAVEEVRAAS
ncbi:MAG: 3-dehydroquinate synthase [Phycisphaerae bacterium]|nr:3-dehydroquinate synthase [Phycisphaerae bacterium]